MSLPNYQALLSLQTTYLIITFISAYNMVACRITDARNGGSAGDSQVPLKK